MTNAIEAEAKEYIRKIDEMGGAVEAIDKGYIQKEIQDSAYACLLYTSRQLDDHNYILPGLGDAGDRIFGTK